MSRDNRNGNPSGRYQPPGIANPTLGIAIIILLFIPIACWQGYNYFRASNLAAYGVQATGRVSSWSSGAGGKYIVPKVAYTFEVNGRSYDGSSTYGSSVDLSSIESLPTNGQIASITYDRENPAINSYDPEADMYHAGRIVEVDAAGSLGLLIYLLMKMRRA